MADFTALKNSIQTYIKQNGNEEITGEILQEILLSMVTTLGDSAINDLITALNNEVTARQNADGTLQQNITNEATARGNADTALGGRIDDEATARANGDTALSNRLGSTITPESTAADQIGAEAEARESADTALGFLISGITSNIENGYVYAGIATPSSTPATGKVFYLALTAGTYTNFGSTVVSQGINILKYNGSAWSLDAFIGIDDVPTPSSTGIPKSGGTFDFVMKNGSAFDISAHFASGGTLATYADLSAALAALDTLPAAYKRGGMVIRYVDSSDNNKYIQARCMAQNFTTDVTQWQVVDDEPTADSENLVKSGGVADYVGFEKNAEVTSTSTSINCKIEQNYKSGTGLYIETACDSTTAVYSIRVHHPSDDTFTIIKANHKGNYTGFVILDKDIDYIQAVNFISFEDGVTISLNVKSNIKGEILHSVDLANSYCKEWIMPIYEGRYVCLNGNISYNVSSRNIIVTLNTTSPSNNIVGYVIDDKSNSLSIYGQNIGVNEYTIPYLSNLVFDITNRNIAIVSNSALSQNHILLLRNVNGGIERCIGPLADILRYKYLNSQIEKTNTDLLVLGKKDTVTATAQSSSISVSTDSGYKSGDVLDIIAYTDTEQTLNLRYRKNDDSAVVLATFTKSIHVTIILSEDIKKVEVVNFISAVDGSHVYLSVVNNTLAKIDINSDKIGNSFIQTVQVSNNSVRNRITNTFIAGQEIYYKISASAEQLITLRAHTLSDTFIQLFYGRIGEQYGIVTLTDNIDYIEAVNFISAVNNSSIVFELKTGLDGRLSKVEKDVNNQETNLATIISRQNSTYIPTYYENHVEEKTVTIRNRILNVNGISDSFIFLTDVHWYNNMKKSPLLISELLKRGLAHKVIMGGDVCSAYTPAGSDWVQPKEIQQQMLLNGMVNDYCDIYNVRGNHDFNGSKNNIIPGQSGSDNYTWNAAVTRNLIVASNNDIVTNQADQYGCYYYFDNDIAKIRYFIIYAIESGTFSVTQESWFINNVLSIPEGYDIVIINHDGCENTVGLQCPNICPDVAQLVNAINRKQSGITTTNNISYDFSSINANVLLFMSGHTHHDLQTFDGTIVNICSVCDSFYPNGSAAGYLGGNAYERVKGTVSEQAFEHVLIDKYNGDVYCTRIGAGCDRIFRATLRHIQVSGSITLESVLNVNEWGSYNNDTDWYNGNSFTPSIPTNTRVSVNNGVVTGIASGQAVVYAKDADGNREFFNIVVE